MQNDAHPPFTLFGRKGRWRVSQCRSTKTSLETVQIMPSVTNTHVLAQSERKKKQACLHSGKHISGDEVGENHQRSSDDEFGSFAWAALFTSENKQTIQQTIWHSKLTNCTEVAAPKLHESQRVWEKLLTERQMLLENASQAGSAWRITCLRNGGDPPGGPVPCGPHL